MSDLKEALAAAVEARGEEVYPRDIFIPPSAEDFAEINALLKRERGHQLDGVAGECYRRAYSSIAAQIRDETLPLLDIIQAHAAEGGSQGEQAMSDCNCVVTWDWVRETHVWLNGSFDGSCGHPATGTKFEETTDDA